MDELPNRPLTKQRSPWIEEAAGAARVGKLFEDMGIQVRVFRRAVSDGQLFAILGEDEPDIGWHLSVSWHPPAGMKMRAKRYPNWDELMHARWELLPHDIGFVMHFPTPEEYLAVHDTTFHLHEEHDHGRVREGVEGSGGSGVRRRDESESRTHGE